MGKKKYNYIGIRALGENEPKRVPRGQSMYGYDEVKRATSFTLTDTVKEKLSKASEKLRLSRSECLEKLLRSDFFEKWLRYEEAQMLDKNEKDQE